VVAPGTILVFAGIYYWYPKAPVELMNEFWAKSILDFIDFHDLISPADVRAGHGRPGAAHVDGGVTYARRDDPTSGSVWACRSGFRP